MNQVRSITDNNISLQSGSVFYERAKLTDAQYKHRVVLYTVRARIPNIWIPNPFDYRTFQSSVFECYKKQNGGHFVRFSNGMDHSKTELR